MSATSLTKLRAAASRTGRAVRSRTSLLKRPMAVAPARLMREEGLICLADENHLDYLHGEVVRDVEAIVEMRLVAEVEEP